MTITAAAPRAGRFALFYEKRPLPPAYQRVISSEFPHWLKDLNGPLQGLRITGGYVFGGEIGGAGPAVDFQQRLQQFWLHVEEIERTYEMLGGEDPRIRIGFPLAPRSILADANVGERYPPTGVLELRGVPAFWESNRRRGVSPLGDPFKGRSHPDDAVEWIRYVDVVDDPVRGHLFVGRIDGTDNFRGYPERAPRRSEREVDRRRQLDHAAVEPLRLVMELSEGGAGRGDYVSITSRDSQKHESRVYRVYKTAENIDGRFFASLMPTNGAARQGFDHTYRRSDEPRLVKFPSWALPQDGSGSVVLFGQIGALGGAPAVAGGSPRYTGGRVRPDGEDDPTGVTIDEVKKYRNTTIDVNPRFGPRVRFVVVPLPIQMDRQASGLTSLSSGILSERAITPSSPLDVLVVAVSRERGRPSMFAGDQEEGVVRIDGELFYFEDPRGGEAAQTPGTATFGGAAPLAEMASGSGTGQPTVAVEETRLRNRLVSRIAAANMRGHFEPEGFARLESSAADLREFYEVFYYRRLGGGFQQALRGQFGTPVLGANLRSPSGARIHSVTRRLRLIGRSLLGTPRQTHSLGSPIAYVPYLRSSPVSGPITNTGISVRNAQQFTQSGYLIIDSGAPGVPWEIVGHLGAAGRGLLKRARDERGRGLLRACFGTPLRAVSPDMFAFELPYRYPDRYAPEVDSESLAYLQKSFRVPGARWRAIEWRERPSRAGRDRRADVVVAARFDGEPEWDAKPTNQSGGLYLFENKSRSKRNPVRFEIDRIADQMDIRIYFRYQSGAYTPLGDGRFTDDWKETPILDTLHAEYEKPATVHRHERLPF